MPAQESLPVSAAELKSLFADLDLLPALVLAVSGGPDSTALMVLAARWLKTLKRPPKLVAVTVDHRLRPESGREAATVARLARKLGVVHRTLRWTGRKPKTGLQQAARVARYRLLGDAARKAKASHILTAHTRDDQAETVLIRMSRGSGLSGLGAMQRISVIPGREPKARLRASSTRYGEQTRNPDTGTEQLSGFRVRGLTAASRNEGILLIRPLLDVPKSRLIATLRAAKIPFADDPSNRDPRFTRARLRILAEQLAREGLDARRLALLARRLKRADQAIEAVVDQAEIELAHLSSAGMIVIDAAAYLGLPAEIGLRLLGRALDRLGHEGPVELAKLEMLQAALDDAARNAGNGRFRRSLAGAIVTLAGGLITVEGAPRRRRKALTTRQTGNAKPAKAR